MNQQPKVGVAVIVTKGNQILLMKRKGAHGRGTWSTPGGHLEIGESPEECAAREAKEEVGIDVVDIRFRAVTNDIFDNQGKHYVTLWMVGISITEVPTIAAENEVDEIGWYRWDDLPEPLFLPLENLVKENCYPPK
jgi:8-oxo-dGTP diphosphatase